MTAPAQVATKKDLLREANLLRELLSRLSGQAMRNVEDMIEKYLSMGMSPAEVQSIVVGMFPELVQRYAAAAAEAGTQWYGDLSPDADYQPDTPPIEDLVPAARLISSASWAVNNIADGVFDEARKQRLMSDLGGSTTRAVFDGSRNTVAYNAKAEGVRLRRVAQPDACLFCATLATRGAVYLSGEKAEFYTKDGERQRYHDHCQCIVVPERVGTEFIEPEYYEMYNKRYEEARKAVGPHSAYKDDPDKNAYLKAILAKMREQAREASEFGELGRPALVPAWSTKGWTPQRKRLRKRLAEANSLFDIEVAAQDLLPDTKVVFTHDTWDAQPSQIKIRQLEPDLAANNPQVYEQLRGLVRAVDDFNAKYPNVRVQELTVQPDTDSTFAYTARLFTDNYLAGSATINMNGKWVNATSNNVPAVAQLYGKTLDAAFDDDVTSGWHYRRDGGSGSTAGQPSTYAVTMHELGHAICNNHSANMRYDKMSISPQDNAGRHVAEALSDYYARTHAEDFDLPKLRAGDPSGGWTAKSYTGYQQWLEDNLSGYSLKPGSYMINESEALAEAFADVEINGEYARETSKVLHQLAVDYYNGSSPYGVPVGAQFGAPWQRRGILQADPEFAEWPDYRHPSDKSKASISYTRNRGAGTQPKDLDAPLDGADPVVSRSKAAKPEPVQIPFLRNNNGMRQVAGFDQDVEPWGRYMSPADPDVPVKLQPGWERGTATLDRPLYVEHDGGQWKSKLSAQYGGATGEELSQRLLEDGFDGVVTRDDKGIVEFVDVRSRSQRRFTVEDTTSTWQQAGIPPLVRTSWDDAEYAKLDDKRLTKAQRASARKAVDEHYARLAAGKGDDITSKVYQTLVDAGATPHGLEYRLKEPPSLYRKVQGQMADKGIDAADALAAMRDTVRFTAVVPARGYWKSGDDISAALVKLGAVPEKVPAGISLTGYRGRNMTFFIDGQEFELQIHTEKSMAVKDVCHKLYEEERLPTTTPERRKQLQAQQQRLWDTIPYTKGTPVIDGQKSKDVLYTVSEAEVNIGPTVPVILRNAKGEVSPLFNYGSVQDGLSHPDIDLMTNNTVFDDMAAWTRLTDEEKEWGILWYDRLNWFLAEDSLGTRFEGDQRRLAAIYAALSPRTDFDVNYAAVQQVLRMDPEEIARLAPQQYDKDKNLLPPLRDEKGVRPTLNGVIPDNLNRVKRLLEVDSKGNWVVEDPVWALRGTGANDMYYRRPGKDRVRLYHRSTLENADAIRVDQKFKSNEGKDVFFSDTLDEQALGYGNGVVVVDVPRAKWQPRKGEWTPGIDDDGNFHGIAGRVDDAFPSGEQHYAISLDDIDPSWIRQPSAIPDARAENKVIARRRAAFDEAVYQKVLDEGGVTISLDGESPTDGFAFAPSKTTEQRIPLATFKPEDVDHYLDRHWDQLERKGAHLGLWVEGDYVFLDVSKVGKPTAATLKAAQEAQQLAVYDLGNHDTVVVGKEDAGGGFEKLDTPAHILNQHKREVERRVEEASAGSGFNVLEEAGLDYEKPAGPEEAFAPKPGELRPYLELQRGPRDQTYLDAAKIYNHALNVLGEEDYWAVTVDTWDARVKLALRDDYGEARRVLDSGKGWREEMQIYQEFSEATRRATEIIKELDPQWVEFAKARGFVDLLPKHVQAAVWGAARRTHY